MTRRPAAGAMLMCLAACTVGGEAADRLAIGDSGQAPAADVGGVTRADSAAVRAAEGALASWLTASRESTASGGAMPNVGDAVCGESGAPSFPSMLLADFSLLPFEMRDGTIVGRAEVVTVAEQDVDRRATDRFVARSAWPARCWSGISFLTTTVGGPCVTACASAIVGRTA